MIGIVDYGAGNLASVHNAFERIGEHSEVFEDSKLIDNYDRIVLPGVGSFSKAMHLLTSKGWKEAILNHINDKKMLQLEAVALAASKITLYKLFCCIQHT